SGASSRGGGRRPGPSRSWSSSCGARPRPWRSCAVTWGCSRTGRRWRCCLPPLTPSLLRRFAQNLASSFPADQVLRAAGRQPLTQYQHNPVGYLREVLGLNPWPVQEEIARALLEPPYRVAVKAAHSVGKTWLAAALTSWF